MNYLANKLSGNNVRIIPILSFIFAFLCLALLHTSTLQAQNKAQQADFGDLEIQNDSKRVLTVKVMHKNGNGRHSLFQIKPGTMEKATFTDTLEYYLKVKAELDGQKTMYWRDGDYQPYDGSKGFIITTIQFDIDEGSQSEAPGASISEDEFERDDL